MANVVPLTNRPPLRKYWVALEPDSLGNEYAPVPVHAHLVFDNRMKDENTVVFRRYHADGQYGTYLSAQFDGDSVRYFTLDENFDEKDLA